MATPEQQYDVIVIGGGHAGLEAAWAAANLGARTALVTLDPAKIGVMSCNPAIGGLAKGHMVREIDALGGLMGIVTDRSGIMFKVLNTSRGPAVRGPRAQCDKHLYARTARELIAQREEIDIIAGSCESFIIEEHDEAGSAGRTCTGVVIQPRDNSEPVGEPITLRAPGVVLTTGTFMRGLMHEGERKTEGGRVGEAAAVGVSASLAQLGFELGRLKTGTPPRLKRDTIDWESLEPQSGDVVPIPFSDLTEPASFPVVEQVQCRITRTTGDTHEMIRSNLDRAPMFTGDIEGAGPRYCPSIEDKVVRFPDRESHHVFLEPESHESDWVYCNGISTSLPRDVQEGIVRALPGCENAQILQHGYAVEYDMVRPHQILPTCETKLIHGLYLAGQINGTSGYEEAAGQGLVAGVNAVRRADKQGEWVLGRDEAYIGVMMDDLVTRTPREPYRMFTSRAEYRLLLRADNAADRLTPIAEQLGLATPERVELHAVRAELLAKLHDAVRQTVVEGTPLEKAARRPDYTENHLVKHLREAGLELAEDARTAAAVSTVLADLQYAGYITRQRAEVKRFAEMERKRIPTNFDWAGVEGLRTEAKEALLRFQPDTVGRAGRLEGVNPADLTLMLVALKRSR